MKTKTIAATILVVVTSLIVHGQTRELTMSECIQMATDSSLQAFRVKNMYRAGYWEYKTYKAARLPSLSLSMTPVRYNRDFVSRYDADKNIDVYRQQQSLYSYGNLSLSQNVDFTGGTFYIDSELGYFRNIGTNSYSQFTSVPLRVGYSQALFGFNSFKWERKIEPLKFEKAKKEYLYNAELISEAVIERFFNLAMAQAEYDLAVENVRSTDSLYSIGSERQQIAAISQADLLTLKLDALNARNSVKTLEVDLKRAMFSFVSYLNLPKDSQLKLHVPAMPSTIDMDAGKVLELARENNPDYLQYRQNVLEAERELERTVRKSAFDASVSASVGFNQVADDFHSAYLRPLQQDVVRIGLTVPLLDWGVRRGKVNMARSNLNVTRISADQSVTGLEQDVVLTVSDFSVQQNLITGAAEAKELAALAFSSTRQRFMIGKADINSLTLSLNRLNTAQKNYIVALKNYWLSYYKLRKLSLYDFEKNNPLSVEFDQLLNGK